GLTVTLAGGLAQGANALNVSGSGTLALNGATTGSGGIQLNGGTLSLGNAQASGTGALTFNGGNLDCSVANLANANNNPQNWNADFTFLGSQSLDLGTGAVTLGANRIATVSANTLTVGGAISGAFSLTKAGAGALAFAGVNTYNGNTVINAGELTGQTGGACSNSALTVASGATNGVKVAAANGQWTCAGLTYNSGTTYSDFDFGSVAPSTTTAPLNVAGNLATNGTIQIIARNGAGFTAGQVYPLIVWSGSGPGNLLAFAKPSLPSGVKGTLTLGSKSINLNAGIYVPNLFFTNAPGVTRIISTSDLIAAGLASSRSSPSYTITVSPPANGGAAFTNASGTMMKYTNSASFSGSSDSFTYTVSDGTSSASATVNMTMTTIAGPGMSATGTDGSGHPVISFHGIPNYTYHMQRSSDLTIWTTLQTVTCDSNGNATWTDTNAPIPNPVFYRLAYP
ncbi:MAG TPA: autotransporter-associated beta strand repeat-containing protein, partial [Verrucomicrobiae bacterium]